MSTLATPSRLHREDVESVPSSPPPAGSASQLTPRSKVKAMLASLDEDRSGDEHGLSEKSRSAAGSEHNPGDGLPPSSRQLALHGSRGDDYESEDSDISSRPHGRLARMMHSAADADTSDEDVNGGSAYRRIAKQLLRKNESNSPSSRLKQSSAKQMTRDDGDGGNGGIGPAAIVPLPSELLEHASESAHGPQIASRRRSSVTSPGLFMSPEPSDSRHDLPDRSTRTDHQRSDSDSDLPKDPKSDPQFLAAVESKREQRQAAEAEETAARRGREKQAKADRPKKLGKARRSARSTANSDSDSAVDRRLTQQARPTRKATKEAREQLHRESQRLMRNTHLGHEPKTKKKITKQTLFDRFNFRPVGTALAKGANSTVPLTSSTTASDAAQPHSTPPTSPSALYASTQSHVNGDKVDVAGDSWRISDTNDDGRDKDDLDLPSMGDVLLQRPAFSKPEEARKAQDNSDGDVWRRKEANRPRRAINRAKLRQSILTKNRAESDSDLEIVPVSKAKALLSEHVPQGKESESHALLVLRSCAQLNKPDQPSVTTKPTVSYSDMQSKLRWCARQQAMQERVERVEGLKRRGIIPQTEQERIKEDATIEELVEKARKEADELSKREKAAREKEGEPDAEATMLDDSSDAEDASWNGEDEEADVELSGSEDEGEEEPEQDEHDGEAGLDDSDRDVEDHVMAALDVTTQGETQEEAQGATDQGFQADEEDDDGGMVAPALRRPQRATARIDSEDEEEPEESNSSSTVDVPMSATKARVPNLSEPRGPIMGLTQMFAGTLAESQPASAIARTQADMTLDFLRQAPAPSLPAIEQVTQHDLPDVVDDSQLLPSQVEGDQDSSASPSPTQMSAFPDPTQDIGFSKVFSPLRPPPSTVDTVVAENIGAATVPPVKRRSRLRTRMRTQDASDGEVDDRHGAVKSHEKVADAFSMLLGESRPSPERDAFSKKKSRAREMVYEQAEESEDEYAGLGGASEDGSDGEDDDMSDLLDDQAQDVDEQDLAALMADKDRADDKRQVEKIYKDVMTGGLRRKRGGADLDLSDSDYDEDERRRVKRMKEAKLRQALMADENVEKIATNPKKSAFFRSIEDRDRDLDDELNLFDDGPETVPDSQGDACVIPPVSQVAVQSSHKRRRSVVEHDSEDENRAPPYLRGRRQRRRTINDIRHTLSTLVAPPNALLPASDSEDAGDSDGAPAEHDDDDDDDDDAAASIDIHSSRHIRPATNPFLIAQQRHASLHGPSSGVPATKSRVINRLSLRRTNSTSAGVGRARASNGRLAFHNPLRTGSSTVDEDVSLPMPLRRAMAATRYSSAATSSSRRLGSSANAKSAGPSTSLSTSTSTSTFSTTNTDNKNKNNSSLSETRNPRTGHTTTGSKSSSVSITRADKFSATGSAITSGSRLKAGKMKNCSVSSFLRR